MKHKVVVLSNLESARVRYSFLEELMRSSRLLSTLYALLVIFPTGAATAQEIRRRTLLVAPNEPVETASTILIHKDIPTALVFEEAPKAVKLDGGEGRVDIDRKGKLVLLVPLVELAVRERLTLTVTAPDDSQFVFGVMDGFNTQVDGQVTVRRGRVAEPEPADGFIAFLLSQKRSALKEIRFHKTFLLQEAETLRVEGAVMALDFAIVLVKLPLGQRQNARVRMYGTASAELEVAGVRSDEDGLLLAVRKPVGEVDSAYSIEVETSDGVTLVRSGVTLWPTATAQRTRNP